MKTDEATTEIKNSLSSLMSVIQHLHPEASQRSSKKPKGTPLLSTGPEILSIPLKMPATVAYIGPTHAHLVTKAGDDILVHAWSADRQTATAYNKRSNHGGLIPVEYLQRNEAVPEQNFEVVYFERDAVTESVGDLIYKAGDHVRVCKLGDFFRNRGVGFNLATGAIGRFYASDSYLVR